MRNSYGHLEPQMDQIGFANHLQNMAFCFYDNDTYQPYQNFTESLQYERLSAESLYFNMNGEVSKLNDVNRWLVEKNISEIAPLRRGGAYVFAAHTNEGKDVIIRIPVSRYEEDHHRINHPAVLQPFPGATLPYGKGNIEILPFVKVMGLVEKEFEGLSPIEVERAGILRSMYQLAGLSLGPGGVKNDLGILPDGTPVVVDPDILKLRTQLSSEQQARRQQIILEQFPYMAPVAWTENGKPKQDKFFGADYLTGAPPTMPISKLDGNPRGSEKPALSSPPQG